MYDICNTHIIIFKYQSVISRTKEDIQRWESDGMTWSEWGEGEGEMAGWGWFKSMGRGRRDIGVGKE